ncbi:MAG TPA: cysteine peptidase family C39 domain-containing protein [bacterium]|jgi:hypothetical protein
MKLIDNDLKSFSVKGTLPQWAYWVIAAVFFAIAWTGVNMWARAFAMDQLSRLPDNWISEDILIQDTNYSCVPASMVMLLKSRGINTSTYEVARVSGTSFFGTGADGIIRGGRYFGFRVEKKKLGFEDVIAMDDELLVIFRYEGILHAAAVEPHRDFNTVYVRDSVEGLLVYDKEQAEDYFGSDKWTCYTFSPLDTV